MNTVSAILFDMDGVMVDNNAYHTEAWIEFGKRYNIPITAADINTLFGQTNREILKFFFQRDLDDKVIHIMAEEKEQIYRNRYVKKITPAPGLVSLLEAIRRMGIKTAVATSGPAANLQFVLRHTGLAGYFQATVDDTQVSRGKPDPEVFLKAALALHAEPSRCIVFEDSVFGVEAAIAAGMKVVAITTTYTKEQLSKAHRIIRSFAEITVQQLQDLMA